jgi:8-oxo-dGTP pyrophosphatase MutT (NUDIX family)
MLADHADGLAALLTRALAVAPPQAGRVEAVGDVAAALETLQVLRRRLRGARLDDLDEIIAEVAGLQALPVLGRDGGHATAFARQADELIAALQRTAGTVDGNGNLHSPTDGRFVAKGRTGVLGSVLGKLEALRDKLGDDDRGVLDRAMDQLRGLESSDVDDDDLIEDEPEDDDEEDGSDDMVMESGSGDLTFTPYLDGNIDVDWDDGSLRFTPTSAREVSDALDRFASVPIVEGRPEPPAPPDWVVDQPTHAQWYKQISEQWHASEAGIAYSGVAAQMTTSDGELKVARYGSGVTWIGDPETIDADDSSGVIDLQDPGEVGQFVELLRSALAISTAGPAERADGSTMRRTAADVAAWNAAHPDHVKDAHGKWADVPDVGTSALANKLKGAGRIDLEPGERLLNSDRTRGENGRAWLAVVEKDGEKSLRIGLGNANFGTRHDHGEPWRAGPDRTAEINEERAEMLELMEDLENEIDDLEDDPDADPVRLAELRAQLEEYVEAFGGTDIMELPNGHTAILGESAARQLRETLAKALDDGERLQAALDAPYQELDRLTVEREKLRYKAMGRKFTDEEDAEWDRLTSAISRAEAELDPLSGPERPDAGYWTLAEGSIPGQWADVHYDVFLDDPSVGVEVKLGAVPHGSDMDFDDMRRAEMAASFAMSEANDLVRLLAKLESAPDRQATARSARSYARTDTGSIAAWNAANPTHLKDADGKWADVPGVAALDKLKLGKLAPEGFTVRSSKKVKNDYADIDDIITSVEVPTPNGGRVLAEIWGSDDIDSDWVTARLYVLGPGETTDDAENGDEYASFRGLKGLNKLIAGFDLETSGHAPSVRQPSRFGYTRASAATHAGFAVLAADTGRVLMLQRALDDTDPAGGAWEFPGGSIEDGETPLDAAKREWSEETGCQLPDGEVTGQWRNGIYCGYVWQIADEGAVEVFGDRDDVTNPDDPGGDSIEALAWWDPAQLTGTNPALRAELRQSVSTVLAALDGAASPGAARQRAAGMVDEHGNLHSPKNGKFVSQTGFAASAGRAAQQIVDFFKSPTYDKVSTHGHITLDLVGLAPGFGEPFDLANAAWYLAERQPKNALLSLGSAVPGLGYGTAVFKVLKHIRTARALIDVRRAAKAATRSVRQAFGVPLDGGHDEQLLAQMRKRWGTDPRPWAVLHAHITQEAGRRQADKVTGSWFVAANGPDALDEMPARSASLLAATVVDCLAGHAYTWSQNRARADWLDNNGVGIFQRWSKEQFAQAVADEAVGRDGKGRFAKKGLPGRSPNKSWADRLATGITIEKRLSDPDNTSHVDLVRFGDGSRAISKISKSDSETAKAELDAEELGAHVARVLKQKTPPVHRSGNGEAFLGYVHDTAPSAVLAAELSEGAINPDSAPAKRVGLLDTLIENSDRNTGGLFLEEPDLPDSELISIDHGNGWYDTRPSPWGETPATQAPWPQDFQRYLVRIGQGETKRVAEWADSDLSPEYVESLRPELEALRPDFERLGRADWHDRMMTRLDIIASHAKGTVKL